MTGFRTFLTAAALAGAAAIADPAIAQATYPNPGEQILQGVIDSLLGQRYNVTDRRAVRRCANAALEEAWQGYGPGRRDNPWVRDRRGLPQMRVTAITDVDRRSWGLNVRGLIDSGMLYGRPYPDRRNARVGDLRFRCVIDYNGRISNLRVQRNPDFRPY